MQNVPIDIKSPVKPQIFFQIKSNRTECRIGSNISLNANLKSVMPLYCRCQHSLQSLFSGDLCKVSQNHTNQELPKKSEKSGTFI